MAKEEPDRIVIRSFMESTLEESLRRQIEQEEDFSYSEIEPPPGHSLPERIAERSFWSQLSVENVDVFLVPMTSRDMDVLSFAIQNGVKTGGFISGAWTWMSSAVVAVLAEDSLCDAVRAAQLDFDGILAAPFNTDHVKRILLGSIERSRRRAQMVQRYDKVRKFSRKVNRNRRHLRDKVDLLCRDLVHSNTNLTNTLLSMRRVHDFQCDLTGEFDLRYMLHKALRTIKEQVPDSSAAIYLTGSNDIEAHISGPWYDDQRDLAELEGLLKKNVIPKVVQSGSAQLIADAGAWQEFSATCRRDLAGLSLMALPLILNDELTGVLVIYRNLTKPLEAAENRAVEPYLLPLARAITAIQKLQHLIA